MTTYRTPTLSLDENPIPKRTLIYFRRALQHEVHELAFRIFRRLAAGDRLSKATLASRIGKDPATITRVLGGPSNWTLDTLSDVLVGMAIDPRTVVIGAADAAPVREGLSPTRQASVIASPPQRSVGESDVRIVTSERPRGVPIRLPGSSFAHDAQLTVAA